MKKTFKSNCRAQLAINDHIDKRRHHQALANKYAKNVDGLQSVETADFEQYFYHMVRVVEQKLNILREIKQLELTLRIRHRDLSEEFDNTVAELHKLHAIAKHKVQLRVIREFSR